MTQDEAHTSHSHGFELPEAPPPVARNGSRTWRVVAGVALCLGLAGIVTGLIVARRQSLSDEQLLSDALQRAELQEGWRALGAAAAQEAQTNTAPPNSDRAVPAAAPTSSAASASAAPPNVVIVNVPPQGVAAAPPNSTPSSFAPSNVTNINLPSVSPNQSLPPLDFSPVPGYVPIQPGYAVQPTSEPPTSNLPQSSEGTTTSGVPPAPMPVGNGSIPGSTPNPALPNNGLVGSSPVPGLPNGPGNNSPPPTGTRVP